MTDINRADAQRHESEALSKLRATLIGVGMQTQSSAGENAFFYAFLRRDGYGNPSGGLFIVTSGGIDFSWSRDGKHSLSDVHGAAHQIEQIIREQELGG